MHEAFKKTNGVSGRLDVLFINHPNVPYTARHLLTEPIDILTAASYVRKSGHTIRVLDMDAKRLSANDLRPTMERYLPKMVVMLHDHHIPLHTNDALGSIGKVGNLAKDVGAKVILGGKRATFDPKSILVPGSPIDVAISRDVEKQLVDLLNLEDWDVESLKKIKGIAFMDKGEIIKTDSSEKINLEECQVLDRSMVDLSDYGEVRTMLSSRGCSEACTFCPVTGFWGKWRGRSPENVVDEIQYLTDNCQAQKIMLIDDNATANQERMRELSKIVLQRDIKVKMGCLGTISSFDRETMEAMYAAGFRWIHYGVESGSNRVLQRIGKNLTRQRVKDVIDQAKKIGFRIRTSWILDLPDTTETDLDNTIDLIRETQSDEVRLHYFTPRMGSADFAKNGADGKTSEYIHGNIPNVNYSKIPFEVLKSRVENLLNNLSDDGYQVVKDSQLLKYDPKLSFDKNAQKIVAFCALRYGINW